jgi:hypothetical protein
MTEPTFKYKSHDSLINITPVKCANCDVITGYANATAPTRTIKQVCSVGCAADKFGAAIRVLDG